MTDGEGLMNKGLRVRLRFATDERLVAAVRQGDSVAFEALYERHVGELLSFCVYMLGSRQDAEDAVQATFASAYRALRADRRRIALRPWLFTIARNESLSILRSRRPTVELNGEPALGGDPLRELELREDVRHMLEDLRKLPESQRAALVLAEMHGLSQVDIGTVLGVRPDQVKAYIFQARSNLLSERRARETDCREIREELANARGAALLRRRLRRHLRSCQDCRTYADGVARQRRQLGALLPFVPSLVLKYRALRHVLESGVAEPTPYAGGAAATGSVVGAALELAGGGAKAVALKLATGVACLCASVGIGASVLASQEAGGQTGPTPQAAAQLAPLAAVASANALGLLPVQSRLIEAPPVAGRPTDSGPQGSGDQDGSAPEPAPPAAESLTTPITVTRAGGSESERGGTTEQTQSEQERQRKREENRQKSEEGRQAREEHKGQNEERRKERETHKTEREQQRKQQGEEREQEREEADREREEANRERDEAKREREDAKHEREEREHEVEQGQHSGEEVGFSGPPPNKEKLQHVREERKQERQARKQKREERRLKREARELKREARKQKREEREDRREE